MKPKILLRIASIITLLYFVGHTVAIPWTPAVGPGESPVIEAMKTHPFEITGFTRTYWDFYLGFGLMASVFLAFQAVVLWLLGGLANRDAGEIRPVIAAFFVSFALNAVLISKYFFTVPLVMTIAIAICLALAFASARSSESAPAVKHE
jgi:hypothetical protein